MDTFRYPVEATAVGLVENEKQKFYMLSILWSDHNNIIIYRTRENFKDLAKEIRNKYPLESGLVNKSQRILPVLRDAPLLVWGRTSSRFMERLQLLEVYSRALLRTDCKISKCQDVVQFFSPRKEDLSPSFPENSLVIVPSENDQRRNEVTTAHRSQDQPITQPIISQSYLCVENFETKDIKNRPFIVQKGKYIDVLIKDPTGWWLVENEENCLAWFPAPYLVRPHNIIKSLSDGTPYFAAKGYEAQHADEITLQVGVVVEVWEKSDNGWWHICYNGRSGYVPSMFLKPYKNPHQKLQANNLDARFVSTPKLYKGASTLEFNTQVGLDCIRENHSSKEWETSLPSDKRKSRSLSGLLTTTEASVTESLTSTTQLRSAGAWDSADVEDYTMTPSIKKNHGSPENSSEGSLSLYLSGTNKQSNLQTWKYSSFEEPPSRNSNSSTSVLDYDFVPTKPRVPPRPLSQEISSRCTSITRNTALKPSFSTDLKYLPARR
ncbi:NADPH oxidase organizer 1-like [Pelodytes ibericus]